MKVEKCFFNKEELDYLSFVVNQEGLKMDPYKVKVIQEWPELKSKRDIRVFIGFANFYRKFIKDISTLARPITKMLNKNTQFTWGPLQQLSFNTLKKAFTTDPILVRPDYNKQFVIETDASDFAYRAILSQV